MKKPDVVKFLFGGIVFVVIVLIVWGPLTIFVVSSTGDKNNMLLDIRMKLRIGNYEDIYHGSARDITLYE